MPAGPALGGRFSPGHAFTVAEAVAAAKFKASQETIADPAKRKTRAYDDYRTITSKVRHEQCPLVSESRGALPRRGA